MPGPAVLYIIKGVGAILGRGPGLSDDLHFPECTATAVSGGKATQWRVFPCDYCGEEKVCMNNINIYHIKIRLCGWLSVCMFKDHALR